MNYMGTHPTHRYTVSSRFGSVPFNSVSVRNQTCFPVNEGNHLAFQRKNAKLDFLGYGYRHLMVMAMILLGEHFKFVFHKVDTRHGQRSTAVIVEL